MVNIRSAVTVLLAATALPRSATHHTSAIEHDELRRSVDFLQCSKQLGPLIGLARLSLLLGGAALTHQQVSACTKVYGNFDQVTIKPLRPSDKRKSSRR